jgi:hypothetical protein
MLWCVHATRNRWGETQEPGLQLPRWIYHCRLLFGYAMKQHVTAAGRWDAFVIGNVVINHLKDFLPAHLNGNDAASEHYRNCVHHVQYLRNATAHPPAPTAPECLAGLGAMIEVLKADGQDAAVARLQPLLAQLRAIATLPTGGTASIVLSADVLPLWALEAAMQRFGDDLGPKICAHYEPASHAPTLPMNVGGFKSICTVLCNGKGMDAHNPALKYWSEYWGMPKEDRAGFVAAVSRTAELNFLLNHWQHEITLASATAGIDEMIDIVATLGLAPDELKDLQKCVSADAGAPMMVLAEVSGAMRIPFKDPRKYLVGRGPLITGVAARLRTSLRHIEVLYGESGSGKTVAAIGAAYEASDALPVQLFMDGSSVARMRAELARYGRLHVGGVDENANDDELVEATRKQLARCTGWLLLVDDVGHDLAGVLDLLPVDDAGVHVGHVLLTSQRRATWATTVPIQTTEVGELLTDESMAFLGQGVDAAVLCDPAIDVRGYVENDLGKSQVEPCARCCSAEECAQGHHRCCRSSSHPSSLARCASGEPRGRSRRERVATSLLAPPHRDASRTAGADRIALRRGRCVTAGRALAVGDVLRARPRGRAFGALHRRCHNPKRAQPRCMPLPRRSAVCSGGACAGGRWFCAR